MKHTAATCAHLLAAPQWTLVDAKLDVGTELDVTAWRSDLGCAQRESRREARVAAERSARRKQRVTRGESSTRHRAREARGQADPSRPTGRTLSREHYRN